MQNKNAQINDNSLGISASFFFHVNDKPLNGHGGTGRGQKQSHTVI